MQWDLDKVSEDELRDIGISVPDLAFSGTATVLNPTDEGGES
jgi:hypothetical protein